MAWFSNINKSFININKSFININKCWAFININKSFSNINEWAPPFVCRGSLYMWHNEYPIHVLGISVNIWPCCPPADPHRWFRWQVTAQFRKWMFGTGQIRELILARSHNKFLDRQLEGIMPRIDFLKPPLGQVDLGRGGNQLNIVFATGHQRN